MNDVNEQISDVKKTQMEAHDGFSNNIETKMNEVKKSIGVEILGVKEEMEKNEALLTKVQSLHSQLEEKIDSLSSIKGEVSQNTNILSEISKAQKLQEDKMETVNQQIVTLNDKTCDIEIDMLKQKRSNDQENIKITTQITEVEYGLAAHIEVIKGNMEKELTGTKLNQVSLENKIQNFTSEQNLQNDNINTKIQTIRNDFSNSKLVAKTPPSHRGQTQPQLLSVVSPPPR